MDERIMRFLFGAQKQAKRQNEAMANFIEGYIKTSILGVRLENAEDLKKVIADELQFLSENTGEWGLSDKLFVQYILGVEAAELMQAKVPGFIVGKEIGTQGKYTFFYYVGEDVQYKPLSSEHVDKVKSVYKEYERATSKSAAKRNTAEDEAWELIEKILAEYPADMRVALPEDDALAAVWLSQDYWNRRV